MWVAWTAVGFPHPQVSVPHPGNNGYRDISFIPGFNWISGKAVKCIVCSRNMIILEPEVFIAAPPRENLNNITAAATFSVQWNRNMFLNTDSNDGFSVIIDISNQKLSKLNYYKNAQTYLLSIFASLPIVKIIVSVY